MTKASAMMALRARDEDRRGKKQRVFPAGEAALHHGLCAVAGEERRVGPGGGVEPGGPDEERRPAQRLALERRRVAAHSAESCQTRVTQASLCTCAAGHGWGGRGTCSGAVRVHQGGRR
jgi:hypothetical protein